MGGLSTRQRVFVEEYLRCWNATEAARRAGYSPHTARFMAHENLTKPYIKAAIESRVADKAMGADEVLIRLAEHGRSSMRDIVAVNDDGEPVGFNLGPDAPLHLVKKVTVGEKSTAVEMYDAQTALVQIGKHLGLFSEKADITLHGEVDVIEVVRATRTMGEDGPQSPDAPA